MATDYKLRIKDITGALKAEVTDFQSINYVKEVNAPGLLSFSLNGEHSALEYLTENAQIEVWRRDRTNSIGWYVDFYGLMKDIERFHIGTKSIANFHCVGQMSMLSWRIVGWLAGTTNKSSFANKKAEYIMKELVKYNATSDATVANGRVREGEIDIATINIQADGNNGNSLYYYCAWQNLLEKLQELADIGGGDFDLIKVGDATWEFKYYDGQLGTDRSSTVLFSMERGNMANPFYSKTISDRKTAAIVAGQGDGAARDITIVTANNYEVNLRNQELFVDARDLEDTGTALADRGSAELVLRKEIEWLDFDVLQTPSSIYGKHYFLGDIVKATYLDVTITPKIQKVSIGLPKAGRETIDIGMKTI